MRWSPHSSYESEHVLVFLFAFTCTDVHSYWMSEHSEDSVVIKGIGWYGLFTSAEAPVQIEGECDGFPFYFRSRGLEYSLSIDEIGDDPVGVCVGEVPGFHWRQDYEGRPGYAGFISREEAIEHLTEGIAAFRSLTEVFYERETPVYAEIA